LLVNWMFAWMEDIIVMLLLNFVASLSKPFCLSMLDLKIRMKYRKELRLIGGTENTGARINEVLALTRGDFYLNTVKPYMSLAPSSSARPKPNADPAHRPRKS
ncbi:hypothetical protein ACVZYT_004275, partial [Yersinia enterocolitica]